MNILMVSALDIKDKGAQSLKKTIEGYLTRRHKVFFISYKKGPKEPDYFYEDGEKLSRENFFYYNVVLPFPFLDKNFYTRKIRLSLLFPIFVFLKARKIISEKKINLLYGYEVQGVISCSLIKKINKIPIVSRFQGTIMHPLLKNNKIPVKYYDHIFALKYPSDLVIMANDGTFGDDVLERLGVSISKVKFWRNGVANYLFNPKYKNWIRSNYSIGEDTKILLTLSRLVHWKRVDRAIKALKYISKEAKAVLFIIGDGPEKEALELLVKSEGVDDRAIFVGSVEHKEVYKFLNSCDLFLSLYDLSNLGNPVMEAMSCGKCVLAIDHGEMSEIIEDSRTGFLVNGEEKVGEKLLDVLQNESLMMEVGKTAIDFSKKNYWTWEERMDAEIKEVENIVK
ncbi:MAG: glycosyltransferase family 4 protein [Candidatus Woykebacteria bacterium]